MDVPSVLFRKGGSPRRVILECSPHRLTHPHEDLTSWVFLADDHSHDHLTKKLLNIRNRPVDEVRRDVRITVNDIPPDVTCVVSDPEEASDLEWPQPDQRSPLVSAPPWAGSGDTVRSLDAGASQKLSDQGLRW